MIKKYSRLFAFFTGCVLILLVGSFMHITVDTYIYDSMDYYAAARSFASSGKFDFNQYGNTYRGYAFPLLLYLYLKAGNCLGMAEWTSILFGSALFTSFTFTVCLPEILPENWAVKNNYFFRVLLILPVILFWQDLIFYPLSDIYGFGMILMAVILIIKWKEKSIVQRGMLIGILLYFAYNIRTIYLFSGIIYDLVLFVDCYRKRMSWKKITVLYIAMAAGILAAAYPQYKININQHNQKTIAVITKDLNGGELFTSQLYTGMMFDRYETYIGPKDVYPEAPMNFIDRAGVQIIAEEGISGFNSLPHYLSVVLRHPVDYLGIIVRHAAGILYMPWNHAYIYNLNQWKLLFMLLNYCILFLFGISAYRYIKENGVKTLVHRNMAYVCAILFPCAAILFGAVEMRFFMPAYAFVYLGLCMSDWKKTMCFLKKHWIRAAAVFVLAFCLLAGYWGEIMGSAQALPLLMGQ